MSTVNETMVGKQAAIITGPWRAVSVPSVSLSGFVMRDWDRRAGRQAVIDAATGRSFTYAELAAAVRGAAAGLLARGVRSGDVLALCVPNSPEFAIAYYAALTAGATVTAMSPLASEREATALLSDSKARWVITTPDLASMLDRAARRGEAELLVLDEANPGMAFGGPMPGERVALPSGIAADEVAVLLYSSGTTGLPKGVMLSHRNLVGALRGLQAPHPLGEEDIVLAALPLCHIAGMQIVMNHALSSGATVVTLPQFELGAFLGAIERYRITRTVVAPPIVLALAKHPSVERHDLSSLRVLTSGSAPLGGQVARAAADRLGCRVKQGYGMTESVLICIAPDDGPDRPESIGPPAPGVECRVIDCATGIDVPPGRAGELLVRSPAQMRGYLNNQAATAATIDAHGWLHTGDVVRVDSDGWFHVVDRVKELIKYKGLQVPPAELEQILLTHPAVADAAVIGCPDEEAGELPKALVVLREPVQPAELLAFVAGQVAPHKQIRRLEVIDEIPRSPSGKVLRRVLVQRERAASASGLVAA